LYWCRLDLTVSASFSLIDKPADSGNLIYRFLAETPGTQRLLVFT
jgi:hypothetical protein